MFFGLKGGKRLYKGEKTPGHNKNEFLPAFRCPQHPTAGQNTQHNIINNLLIKILYFLLHETYET